MDIEGKFGLISDMIIESKNINEYLVKNNEVYSHIFDILNYDLYNVDNNMDGENNNNDNFNNKYFIYGYFIYLLGKILKYACLKDILKNPTESLVNFINKKKNEIIFSENIIISLTKIIKNNFMEKKPKLILEKGGTMPYEGLWMLNIKIIELLKEVFSFMKEIPY